VDVLVLVLAASATTLATGLGAVPVFLLGDRVVRLRSALWGLAIGVMGVASIVGLLLPALDEGSGGSVAAGAALGVAFFAVARRSLRRRRINTGRLQVADVRTAALVFLVLFVHSLPEGFAIGSAYASNTEGLALFVIVAIGFHNIPEGTSVAIPMQAAGYGARRQFWAAVGTSAPQPVGALAAFLLVEQVRDLLPVSLAFAAGAMLALVLVELVPQAFRPASWRGATVGVVAGGGLMLALSAILGV
jgi:zinc transporter, ZIP family